MNKVKYLWDKFSVIGMTDNLSADECRQIRLLNQFAFIILSCGVMSAIYSCLNHKYYDVFIILIVLCLFSSAVYLQSLGKHKSASLSLHIVAPLVITSTMVIFGKESGIEVFYAPLIITLPIFHSTWKYRLALFAWTVFLLFMAQLYIVTGGVSPLNHNVTQVARITAIIVANICCLAIFASYISEAKQHQNQTEKLLELLKVNNEKLNLANADLERFAYIASHQLKAPVRTISNFLNLIERELRKYPANLHIIEYMDYIKGSSEEMAMLISDLLEYSKVEQEDLAPEPTNLNDALLVVQNNLRATLEQRNARISVGELPIVAANKTHMVVLFQNLVENAVKYNETPEPSVTIYADQQGNLYVKDNGIGIDEQYHQRIFGMFSRLHRQDEYRGTGIGLSVCKKIMERHNGHISLDSKLGEGTTFHLRFSENTNVLSRQNAH